MADTQPFLVEIGTEELPPKSLRELALAFLEQFNMSSVTHALQDAHQASKNEIFFSPRRLAIHAPMLYSRQPDREEQRLGPVLAAAFDDQGRPTQAAEGFAKSCGVTVSQLEHRETAKGMRLACVVKLKGKTTAEILPQIVDEALARLPVAKRMRWGAGTIEFVRPVHWVLMMLGTRALKARILGITADDKTYGHRYHHPGTITIKRPGDYRRALATTGKVLVEDRAGKLTTRIRALVDQAAARASGIAQANEGLLHEVAGLVEWPVPVTGSFDEKFLGLPSEVIIAVLETQQRYFPLRDAKGELLPRFVAISNIRSTKPAEVRRGNERVIVPRLSDAMFFWDKDRKTRLAVRLQELQQVTFQKDLGNLADKSLRIADLAARIAGEIGGEPELAERAGKLCKCDLVTGMVGEFPELQGIMGGYYARHDGEPKDVARAIAEHYLPLHAHGRLPQTNTGRALAIADKLDTLAGIFTIGRKPTGDKDPFGLRRAGLGLMRIVVEGQLNLDLLKLTGDALGAQPFHTRHEALAGELYEFLLERLRAYYLESGIRADVFEAVYARRPPRPLDFHRRVQAVNGFLNLPEAISLTAANKRISNILRQAQHPTAYQEVRPAMFRGAAEKSLYAQITSLQHDIQPLLACGNYVGTLQRLSTLRQPIDEFFNQVLVMDPDTAVRDNRLALLAQLSELFLHTADLALLQTD